MKKEYMLAGLTVLLWGTLPAVSKMVVNRIDPVFSTFCVTFIAFITLLCINMVRGGAGLFKKYSPKDYLRITGLGFLGMFCYTTLYYLGLARLTSQIAAIINYMWPIMIVVFSCIILKERMTRKRALALLVSFCGMLIICAPGLLGEYESNSAVGMLCCFTAAVCYGLYTALNKKYDYDQWIVLNVAFGVTAVLSGGISAVRETVPEMSVFTLPMILGLLWIGIFINAIAYVTWGMAMNMGDTAKISVMAYICPFLSLIFGRLLLDEHIGMMSMLGLVLIVGGILIQIDFGKGKAEGGI